MKLKTNQKFLTKSKELYIPINILSIHVFLPISPTSLGNQGLLTAYLDHCSSPLSSLLPPRPRDKAIPNTSYSFQGIALLMPFSSKSSSGSPLIWCLRQTVSWPHSSLSISLPHFPWVPTEHGSPCFTYSLLFPASGHLLLSHLDIRTWPPTL